MTVVEHVGAAASRLIAVGLSRQVAAIDAEVLARHALGWSRATYFADRRDRPPQEFGKLYWQLVARRERREPVSLIVGTIEFWGLAFEVTADVLSPRPETELLIEEALSLVDRHGINGSQVVDVGTGSGCLAVALAHELSEVHIVATDISEAALRVAKRNAEHHAVVQRITWVRTAFLDGVGMRTNLILANLPYVSTSDLGALPPEVRDFEPPEALVAGSDGLEIISGLLKRSTVHLFQGGHVVVEFGMGQNAAIQDLVAANPELELVRIRKDLQGIPRIAVIRCVSDV